MFTVENAYLHDSFECITVAEVVVDESIQIHAVNRSRQIQWHRCYTTPASANHIDSLIETCLFSAFLFKIKFWISIDLRFHFAHSRSINFLESFVLFFDRSFSERSSKNNRKEEQQQARPLRIHDNVEYSIHCELLLCARRAASSTASNSCFSK